jgi:hypothetical protein
MADVELGGLETRFLSRCMAEQSRVRQAEAVGSRKDSNNDHGCCR